MNKISVKMNEPMCLGLSILDIRKTSMYKYCYESVEPNYGKMVKLCSMDTDSFIFQSKSDYIYADLAGGVKKRFDT